ncbi:flavodoxin domain-containing protein [Actinoplanes couchii]|uniref:NADPH--hemoprotein reductase n=1 Tax=Actinoplanes couchii TaxID=403638 RepID=A0ABQ3X8Q9_9ACTN|nr:NADPH cytochrome P450 oxidoreductase family protein [Actinoplanes couchii]MDR6320095.1 sulfite reductase alpha subunit-like flavoprotein [Actinoplanes couchii]GID54890.1 hypothetical protein Aco03nite_032940 [Actinoplanes couchii]
MSRVATLDSRAGDLPLDGPVVIVTSSYNGNPPDNAARFVDWLTTAKPDLTGVDYLVLGCGSLDWAATYQRVPTLIDEAMTAAGARRLRDRGVIDARTDFFGDWERWYQPLWPLLAPDRRPTAAGPRFRVSSQAVVLENRELVRLPGHGSKRHLEIRLPEGVTYRTGDYLSVRPENDPVLVTRMLNRLGLRPDRICTIDTDLPESLIPVGHPLTAEELLLRYVDLAVPATAGVVARLAETTRCTPERAELDDPAPLLDKRLTVLDLLERFTSCRVDLALALELLPAPRPRQYSISSAAEDQPETAALTVSVVDGGVASGYLSRARPGDLISAFITSPPESFRPPADPEIPIVMIAAGSGVAPFRAFLRSRPAAARSLLFFGCRHPEADDLYADELTGHEVHRAYSRHPDGDITYVQHRLWADRDRLTALLAEGAHVYVCGDIRGMGPAVEETLLRIGGPTLLDDLRAQDRYATDLF